MQLPSDEKQQMRTSLRKEKKTCNTSVQVLAQIVPTGPLKHIFNHVAWLEHQQNPVTPFWICLQNDHKRFEACFNSKANMMTLYYDFTPQLDHTISTTACVFISEYGFQRWVPATTTIVKQHKTCKVMLCQNWRFIQDPTSTCPFTRTSAGQHVRISWF
jgi:hypothetical protein